MSRRFFRCSSLALGALLVTAGCATHHTIMIPRYTEASAPADEFSGAFYEIERVVADRTYTLLAVAYGETSHLGARTTADFAGDVVWLAGDSCLCVSVPAEGGSTQLSVLTSAADGTCEPTALVARVDRTETSTTVVVELPHGTLRGGDGTLVLEFLPLEGEPIVIPHEGRLRGVYLQS